MSAIVLISPHYPEYSMRLADALAADNRVLLVLTRMQYERDIEGQAINGISRQFDLQTTRFETVFEFLSLAWMVFRFRPDVIHIQEASGLKKAVFNLAIAVLFRMSARIILTVHDPVAHSGRDEAIARRIRLPRKAMRKLAHVVAVHGPYCRTVMTGLGYPDPARIVVTRHGALMAPAETGRRLPEKAEFLIFGRMEHYKGLAVAITAARLLAAKGVKFKIRVLGSGPELDLLRPEMDALDCFEIVDDYVPTSMLIDAIQSCCCVLMPYLNATQSGVLAAAFAGYRPVIASRIGGLVDVVIDGKNGLLVTPGNGEDLAAAMQRIATDAGLAQSLRDGAEETARGPLNWDHIVADMKDCYAP